jgi:hypothetical protein
MQITQLEQSGSVAEIATRVYGLGHGDPRLAEAEKALTAANPHLARDIASLPPNTPVVVPNLQGLTVTIAQPVNPRRAALLEVLDNLQKTAEQASNAQLSGSTAASATEANPERDRALKRLRDDIASFSEMHARRF